MKKYTLLAVNDDSQECTICGRTELKKVMWLCELDTDGNKTENIFQCGTTCGAKVLKTSVAKFKTRVKNFASKVYCKKYDAKQSHPNTQKMNDILTAFEKLGLSYPERKSHSLMIEFDQLRDERWEEVSAMVFTVEI